MAQITENVTASKPKIAGGIWVAGTDATLPTDTTTELDPAFKALGFVGDEGIKNSNSASVKKIKAFGGTNVLSIQEEKPDEFKLKFIEALNVDVLKMVYGDSNVTGTLETGITVKANAAELPSKAFVIDLILRDGTLKRTVIPNGAVTEVGEITYSDADAVGYDTTISAFPDESGNTHYEYIKKAGA